MEHKQWKIAGGLLITGWITAGLAIDVCCWDDRGSGVTVTDTANETGQTLALIAGVTSTMDVSAVNK